MNTLQLLLILSCATLALAGSVRDGFGVHYYVGNWTATGVNYTNWSPSEKFYFGDTLTFTVSGGEFIIPVSSGDFNSCSWSVPQNFIPRGPNEAHNVTVLPAVGYNFYISSSEEKCKAGLKLKITVPQPPVYSPKTYTIGDDKGWSAGVDYTKWTANKKFYFGDVFKFVFNASEHTVVEVWESAFKYCNETYGLPVIFPGEHQENGSTTVTVVPGVGTHYYISSVSSDCQNGLKVELEIDPTREAFEPTSSPSAGTPSASGPSEPSSSPSASGPSADSPFANLDSSSRLLAINLSGIIFLLAAAVF